MTQVTEQIRHVTDWDFSTIEEAPHFDPTFKSWLNGE